MNEEFTFLLNKYLDRSITPGEMKQLALLLEEPDSQLHLAAFIDENFENIEFANQVPEPDAEGIYAQIRIAIQQEQRGKVISLQNRSYKLKWIAAAVVMLVVAGLWLLVSRKSERGSQIQPVATVKEIGPPESSRAMITLSDGTVVSLDSIQSGTLATQANITVQKSADGEIFYQPTNGIAKQVVYNTLTNPRGSRVIDMQFTDGSHVWLNAGSSVKYPVAFIGKERLVEVTGEAYFEVTHDAGHPFIVSKGDVSVRVLGTHFNVNAYDDESVLKVTLLEGSVRVTSEYEGQKSEETIKPGEQAQVENRELSVVKNVDLDKVMAWKDNRFYFEEDDMKTIMRQLQRWYNITVMYDDEVKDKYTGIISRDVPISKVFRLFEKTGDVQFVIEGKTVHVKATK